MSEWTLRFPQRCVRSTNLRLRLRLRLQRHARRFFPSFDSATRLSSAKHHARTASRDPIYNGSSKAHAAMPCRFSPHAATTDGILQHTFFHPAHHHHDPHNPHPYHPSRIPPLSRAAFLVKDLKRDLNVLCRLQLHIPRDTRMLFFALFSPVLFCSCSDRLVFPCCTYMLASPHLVSFRYVSSGPACAFPFPVPFLMPLRRRMRCLDPTFHVSRPTISATECPDSNVSLVLSPRHYHLSLLRARCRA